MKEFFRLNKQWRVTTYQNLDTGLREPYFPSSNNLDFSWSCFLNAAAVPIHICQVLSTLEHVELESIFVLNLENVRVSFSQLKVLHNCETANAVVCGRPILLFVFLRVMWAIADFLVATTASLRC